MLEKLTVKNVALIESLELDFCEGLNILSGETGAGKSILVDCLLLILGAKYDKTILRHGADEGFVEGVFACKGDGRIASALEEFGFTAEEILIVSRKFFISGKNEIRINGRLSTPATLSSVTGKLVDIYGQNEYQSLTQKSEHLKILDHFLKAEIGGFTAKISQLYKEVIRIERDLKEIGSAGERERTADILRFQADEIAKAKVMDGEEEELSAYRKLIGSGEKILSALSAAVAALTGGDAGGAGGMLQDAASSVHTVSSLSERFSSLYERLLSAKIEIEDIAEGCGEEISALEFDPDELERVERRLDTLRTLRRKYGPYSEMRTFYEKTVKALDDIENGEYKFQRLTGEKIKKLDEAYALCKTLSDVRKEGAKRLCGLILSELSDLGMEGAEVFIDFGGEFPSRTAFEKVFSADGADRAEFYFSANKGQPAKPLIKIISGGELSRFMLAIKAAVSRADDIPTMIFDEIDTGIGGKIGQAVARKLALISRSHQVLCVTHLPQIAAMADNHYLIEKIAYNNTTVTKVTLLNRSEEVEEISRLSGAKDISAQSTENARQMKEWSERFKETKNQ